MRKIINPYDPERNKCFGCSPSNPIGLHLHFFEEGDEIVTEWDPEFYLQGYLNVLHGGIQATLHDEIASWTVYVKAETAGVTSKLEVSYLKAVYVNKGTITLRSRILTQEERYVTMHTQLFNAKGELCSEGRVTYFVYPQELAIRRFHYPGKEAFFEKEP
jgi:uncharacterized protein (TIGR00369 family)